ncbi:unnamed protein product [Onchocerca flexuosa]|uniref:Uncharacterized protein n=1 Tax=Onchocerca flexuosa TaxID=387005 RepID=A0A3P8A3F2_9BILA|nr:unnamed protein product [Onchocerca flexuosa]
MKKYAEGIGEPRAARLEDISLRFAAASFNVELLCEQNYNTDDLLLYVKSNIPNLILEQKGIYKIK